MMDDVQFDFIIAGGGLAGIVNSILLSKSGFSVLVLEKKNFPFHKVCGEYVSNEVLHFLQSIGFDPLAYGASEINKVRMSDQKGNEVRSKLNPGGFGLSRYTMDQALVKIAKEAGVTVQENCRVNHFEFDGRKFTTQCSSRTFTSRFVISAHGKRDMLDKNLNRDFISRHTGYMGVKYHIQYDYPPDEIGLDHFNSGYCGIVRIENNKYNLCYLYKRTGEFKFNDIKELEQKVLCRNPVLNKIFSKAYFLENTPSVINEIYFEKKNCVEDHVIFCGDSAGLITPLCGNGMSIAIHGAAILSNIFIYFMEPGKELSNQTRLQIEKEYEFQWHREFSSRLNIGRQLQKLSGKNFLTGSVINLMKILPPLKRAVIKSTHGKTLPPFSLKSNHQLHQISHL
jgi:flavin-dependent dehydrogenase